MLQQEKLKFFHSQVLIIFQNIGNFAESHCWQKHNVFARRRMLDSLQKQSFQAGRRIRMREDKRIRHAFVDS